MASDLLFFSLFTLTASSLPPSTLSRHPNHPAEGLPTSNIILRSSEGELFEVNDAFKSISETIKQAMEENGNEDAVSLPEVDSRTLSKVIEYCNKHLVLQDDHSPDSVEKFDSEFVRVEHQTLFALFRAANYLKIERLAYLIGQTVGKMMMMGKTVSEIRLLFNITDAGCRNDTIMLRKK